MIVAETALPRTPILCYTDAKSIPNSLMATCRAKHGRSFLLTALIGALIGSAVSLRSVMRADLATTSIGGGRGDASKSSSSVCIGQTCGTGTARSEKSERSQSGESGNSSAQSDARKNGQGSDLGDDRNRVGGIGDGVTGGMGNGTKGDMGGTIGGSDTGSEEERKRLEEERKRTEEARRKAEEEWKRMESERLRIEAEAQARLHKEEEGRRRRLEEVRKNTQSPLGGGMEDAQQGCFSVTGEWATDRALCMQPTTVAEQKIATQGQTMDEALIKEAQEKELHRKMKQLYVEAPETDQKRLMVLSLIAETSQRLAALRDAGIVKNPERLGFVESSIEWLHGGEIYFTESRNDDEVNQMVSYIRQIVEYGQQIVDEARAVAADDGAPSPQIFDIFLRTERLLLVFPEVLALLAREGVTVDPNLAADYENLIQYFQVIKNSCLTTGQSCGAVDDILTGMQHLQTSIQSVLAVAGRPEVETLIREVVQSRTQ